MGSSDSDHLLVMAATNRPQEIDEAALRLGQSLQLSSVLFADLFQTSFLGDSRKQSSFRCQILK